jgi:hypothetical protein
VKSSKMVAVSRTQSEKRKNTNPALLVNIYRSRRQLGKVANGKSIPQHTVPPTYTAIYRR